MGSSLQAFVVSFCGQLTGVTVKISSSAKFKWVEKQSTGTCELLYKSNQKEKKRKFHLAWHICGRGTNGRGYVLSCNLQSLCGSEFFFVLLNSCFYRNCWQTLGMCWQAGQTRKVAAELPGAPAVLYSICCSSLIGPTSLVAKRSLTLIFLIFH